MGEPERRLTARRLFMVMPTPRLFSTLNLFLAVVVVATSSVHGEPNGGNSEYLLPQRLVRRGFLRFGKRSDLENSLPEVNNQAIIDQENTKGMNEIYDESNLIDSDEEGIHVASPRSFLRFGKRSENYLRFGKRNNYDDHIRNDKKSENYLRFGKRFDDQDFDEDKNHNDNTIKPATGTKNLDGISAEFQPESWNQNQKKGEVYGCTSFGDGYFVICRMNYQAGNARYKKARDFLRFG